MSEKMKEQDSKHKFALYIQDSVLDIAKDLYEKDNCRSVSEFIALNKLRNDCITEVKKINGTISYEDAIRWQL